MQCGATIFKTKLNEKTFDFDFSSGGKACGERQRNLADSRRSHRPGHPCAYIQPVCTSHGKSLRFSVKPLSLFHKPLYLWPMCMFASVKCI